MSNEEPPSKRRRLDALGRLSVSNNNGTSPPPETSTYQNAKEGSSLTGRGSIDGWTSCPLCGKYSKKKYALGKGIASHLVAIHTPWNPTKLSLKIERRKKEEQERQEQQTRQNKDKTKHADTGSNNKKSTKSSTLPPTKACSPTRAEREAWDAKVLSILAQLEERHALGTTSNTTDDTSNNTNSQSQMITRTGSQTTCYRDSLPPFLDAAAKGDLAALQKLVAVCGRGKDLLALLDTRDRHLSIAEHWAAGGGHLECLKYLLQLRRRLGSDAKENDKNSKRTPDSDQPATRTRKLRRRDGKTSLHYAARNGHLNCVKYLIEVEGYQVEEASGEGTLPLHMACFGGHLPVVKYLVENGADVHATNEWGCDAFQFVGLTTCKPAEHSKKAAISDTSTRTIRDLCNYLRHDCKVNLIRSQKQGHSILHKAAQKGNHHVLQWVGDSLEAGGAGLSKNEMMLLGAPDLGGHNPSQIWRKFQGQDNGTSIAKWMESFGW